MLTRLQARAAMAGLRGHGIRSALVVIAVAAGLAGASTALDAWSIVRAATHAEYAESNPPAATITVDSVDDRLLAAVDSLSGVASVSARRVSTIRVTFRGSHFTGALFMRGASRGPAISAIAPVQGTWPPSDAGVVLETSSVSMLGATVGDTLQVQLPNGAPLSIPIAGIARDVGVAPGWMEHVVYMFATPQIFARLGLPSWPNQVVLTVGDRSLDRAHVRALAARAAEVIRTTGHTAREVDVPEPGEHVHAAQMQSLLLTQAAFGVLALFASAFLVVNLVAGMLASRRNEIGVLKALGASPAQIVAMCLAPAGALGFAATAIAVPGALLLGHAYGAFTAAILNFSVSGFGVPARLIVGESITGVFVPLIAAMFPIWRTASEPVAESFRDSGATIWHASFFRLSFLGRPTQLALRGTLAKRQRLILTVAALATGGAVYVGALNLRRSINDSVDLLFSAQRFDLEVRLNELATPNEIEAALRSTPAVGAVEAHAAAHAVVVNSDGSYGSGFTIVGPVPSTKMLEPHVESGRWLAGGDSNAIVVNRRMVADDPGLKVGAQIGVLVGGRAATLTLVGIAESGPVAVAYMARDGLSGITTPGKVGYAAVAASGTDSNAVRRLVDSVRPALARAGLSVAGTQLVSEQRAVLHDHLLMVASFLGLASALLIGIAGLGLAVTTSLAVIERTREIGILRGIGAGHGTIFMMIEAECFFVAIAAWAIALPLSVPLSAVLGNAFGRIMFRVPITWLPDAGASVRWLAISVVAALVAGALPAWSAMRIPAARALEYR